jgi:hypothetical protein
LNVYAVPLVRPDTVIGDADPVAAKAPGSLCTVYPVIADPPTFVGAVKDTSALWSPPAAETAVGAFGA